MNYGTMQLKQSSRGPATILMASIFAIVLSSCGGTGSSSGSGGGGGGSVNSIFQLAPSSVMVGIPLGSVTLYGQGFTAQSQVLVDGKAIGTQVIDSATLTAEIDTSLSAKVGTHQFSVQTGGGAVSNVLTYTVYAPQQGPNVMQAIPGFNVGEYEVNALFVLAADVNGDGLADVITGGPPVSNGASIAILNGQSDGTLSAPQYIPVPDAPQALAVGDVDGNGTLDLVSITGSGAFSTTVSILLGDGHGNFQPPIAQQTFSDITGTAYLADIDGDGKPDLVLVEGLPAGILSTVMWLKNTGGGFAAPTSLATMQGYISIADFNGDGKADIVYTAPGPPAVMHILLNRGNGQFKDQVIAGLNGVVGVPNVLDFNLDSIPDLVVEVQESTGTQLYSFAGNGDGSFTQIAVLVTQPLAQLVTGDFDHDGFPDLAGPGEGNPAAMQFLFGDGHGNFTAQKVVGPEGQFAAVGDFNGDGLPDVVVPDQFSIVSLALGRTDRNFPSLLTLNPATVTSVSAGDINGDGLPDILVGGNREYSIPSTVFINQGNESFQLAAYTDPSAGMLADVTGKGVVDLLGGTPTVLEIWPNNSTPDFSSSPFFLQPASGTTIVADMDGDGHPDIVVGGQVFYGNGAYQFTPVALPSTFSGPYLVGDFNGDGKPDVVGGAYTYLNSGNRAFHAGVPNNLPLTDGALIVVGDLNGDGKDDIAINLPGENWIAIYYSRGDGTFYEGTELDPGQEPAGIVVGDFNGDGKSDLAVGLIWSQQVCLLFNNGPGQFTRSFFASGVSTIALVSSDFNRDGRTDLVIGNFVVDFAAPNVTVVFHK